MFEPKLTIIRGNITQPNLIERPPDGHSLRAVTRHVQVILNTGTTPLTSSINGKKPRASERICGKTTMHLVYKLQQINQLIVIFNK